MTKTSPILSSSSKESELSKRSTTWKRRRCSFNDYKQDIKYLLLQLNENKQTLLDELDEDCDESNWEVFYVKDE